MPRSRRHKYGSHSFYSLYNVVAGRHRHEAPDETRTSRSRLTERPLAPDEYMLRRWSRLPLYPFEEHPDLPDTALVAAIHWYVSRRAAALGPLAFESMDATALLAIAVEIEEKMSATLGSYGHLVYAQHRQPEKVACDAVFSDTDAEEEADETRDELRLRRAHKTEDAADSAGGSAGESSSPLPDRTASSTNSSYNSSSELRDADLRDANLRDADGHSDEAQNDEASANSSDETESSDAA